MKFRLPMLRLGTRSKVVLSVIAFGLSGWVIAQSTGLYREPAARMRAPQPITDPQMVARGLTPEYTSFQQLPPTGRVSNPPPTPKPQPASSSWNWVFGPSGPPPSYMFGSSSKQNPISATVSPPQKKQAEAGSTIGSAWNNVKSLVTGLNTPQSQQLPPALPPNANSGNPAMIYGAAPAAVPPPMQPNSDNGIYTRQPAYRWYGYGTTTPGTNPYAPNGQSPQGSTNWYVQSGATPGAFPEPVQTANLEYPSEGPRYVGNPVFGPEVVASPTVWMNAPPSREPMPTTMATPPVTVLQPVYMMPPPVVVQTVPGVANPMPAMPSVPALPPGASGTIMPSQPRVDVVPGLTPNMRPSREPMPTISVPPRDILNPETPTRSAVPEASIRVTEQPIVRSTSVADLPVQPFWSAANRSQTESVRFGAAPSAVASPAVQAPARSQPLHGMAPMPNFGPSTPPAGPSLPSVPPLPGPTSWNPARPAESPISTPSSANAMGPPPEFRPAVTAPVRQMPATSAPVSRYESPNSITAASWKESAPAPLPMPTPANRLAAPPSPLTLEQQVRNACFHWAKVTEVRQATANELIISFSATSESDARAAAEAISRLGSLRSFTVSFNARIVPK